jgi:hypothetical protein
MEFYARELLSEIQDLIGTGWVDFVIDVGSSAACGGTRARSEAREIRETMMQRIFKNFMNYTFR